MAEVEPAAENEKISDSLESITESDETSTPKVHSQAIAISPAPQTPVTAGRIRPAPEEMHPSKAHQSTTQEPDSGLRLGFSDIKDFSSDQPSGIIQQTPSKTSISRTSFDFKVDYPRLQLGPEAQQMMNELREEALRVRARLAAGKEEENKTKPADGPLDLKRVVTTTTKARRFSGAHMAAFRKMDSIAEHPAAIRAKLSRNTIVKTNLKRSSSRARLDDIENPIKEPLGSEKESKEKGKFSSPQNRLPNKRPRTHESDDVSSVNRMTSSSRPRKPSLIRGKSQSLSSRASAKNINIRSSYRSNTPLRASLHNSSTSEASSTINNCSGNTQQGFSDKEHSPSKFEHHKSNIRHQGANLDTTRGHSALPVPSNRNQKCDLQKSSLTTPNTPVGIGRSKNMSQINFTPKTINKHAVAARDSPSPIKNSVSGSVSKINFNTKLTSAQRASQSGHHNISHPPSNDLQALGRKADYSSSNLVENPSSYSGPGDFTFRSDRSIKFGPLPSNSNLTQPVSIVPQLPNDGKSATMPANLLSVSKMNYDKIISLPHGMSNKRRKRPDSDDESLDSRSSPKKLKKETSGAKSFNAPKIIIKQNSPKKCATPVKKPVLLTLSRLEFLSQPKIRR